MCVKAMTLLNSNATPLGKLEICKFYSSSYWDKIFFNCTCISSIIIKTNVCVFICFPAVIRGNHCAHRYTIFQEGVYFMSEIMHLKVSFGFFVFNFLWVLADFLLFRYHWNNKYFLLIKLYMYATFIYLKYVWMHVGKHLQHCRGTKINNYTLRNGKGWNINALSYKIFFKNLQNKPHVVNAMYYERKTCTLLTLY